MTIKKSIVKQYRTIEQLGKAFLGCACWPGGWGALWDEKSHGYLKVLPPKKQANEVRQVNTVHEWVRNASSPGASERWCMWVATPQLCPVLCKCWLRCMTLTRISQHTRHLPKDFLRCQFTSNQPKCMDSWSWHSWVPHSRKKSSKFWNYFRLPPSLISSRSTAPAVWIRAALP